MSQDQPNNLATDRQIFHFKFRFSDVSIYLPFSIL